MLSCCICHNFEIYLIIYYIFFQITTKEAAMKFFDGVSADDIMKMRKCFGSEPKNYKSGETITVLSSEL